MQKIIVTNTSLATDHIDVAAGKHLIKAYSSNWSGVTLTPKAEINETDVNLKDVFNGTISFTANGYAIFEFEGRISFGGAVGAGKQVTVEISTLEGG